MIKDISAEEFDREERGSEGPVVLEFWVRSCDQCRRLEPVYERLPEEMGDRARFYRINMLESIGNLLLAEGLGVEGTPTTKVFCSGAEVGAVIGYLPLEEAMERIGSLLRTYES